jgi:simple sugar transport system permease protein
VFDSILSIAFFAQALRISVPYILPALGGTVSERGGVVNIALEGTMLMGAFGAVVGTYLTNNPVVGLGCGITAALLLSLVHAVATVTFKIDQIVSGIALNLLALGLTKFFCQVIFHSSSNSDRIAGTEFWSIGMLNDIPVVGVLLGNPFILGTFLLVAYVHMLMFGTRFGLHLRAVGENPRAADTVGISVVRVRYLAVLLCGILSGLGGVWLAFDQHSFTDGMSAGRGFIALAAMIVGKWKPVGALGACLVFGLAEALVIQLQGGSVPTQFIQMIPYILTMVVLAGFIGRATPPAADGVPYEKE